MYVKNIIKILTEKGHSSKQYTIWCVYMWMHQTVPSSFKFIYKCTCIFSSKVETSRRKIASKLNTIIKPKHVQGIPDYAVSCDITGPENICLPYRKHC